MNTCEISFDALAQRLRDEGLLLYKEGGGISFSHAAYDSREVREGTLFICKGFGFKREYLDAAIAAGASGYIAAEDFGLGVPHLVVSDPRRALALVSAMYYGYPARRLHIVGITGTKGKTTTTFFMKGILDAWLPYASAVISTVENYTGGAVEDSHLTTPESLELHRAFAEAAEHGIEYMTMEVSSQAYKLERVYDVKFAVGMFLNFSEDHIGSNEHEDMEDYLRCKLELMKNCRTAVIYSGATHFERAEAAAREAGAQIVTFGTREQDDFRVKGIEKQGEGFSFDIIHEGQARRCVIGMEGRFNIMNAAAAIAAAGVLGVPQERIEQGIRDVSVRGRMNVYDKDGVKVIVDYAHNYLSFEELFKSLREDYPGHRISVVTGCPGGHAFVRRRDIGELCGRYADHVYLTEEDPQYEDAADICREMASYIEPFGTSYEIDTDRTATVERAIRTAKSGDIVILAAKGEEVYMKRRGRYEQIESDISIARRCLGIEG